MKTITRRNFLKLALTSGVVIGSGGIFSACKEIAKNTDGLKNNLEIKFLRQIITSTPKNSRCLMWQTDSPMNAPQVEIRLKNSADSIKISAVDSSFTDDGEKNLQYTAQVENLLPNSDYEYRIFDGENSTNFFELKTRIRSQLIIMFGEKLQNSLLKIIPTQNFL